MTFGFFDTRIEPSLGIGMLVDPSDWLLNEEIEIRDIQLRKEPEVREMLKDRVQATPHRSLLILLHGFREGFASALQKTAFFGHVLDINSQFWFSTGRAIRAVRCLATAAPSKLRENQELNLPRQ